MRKRSVVNSGKPVVWLIAAAFLIGGGFYARLMMSSNSQPLTSTAHQDPGSSVSQTTTDTSTSPDPNNRDDQKSSRQAATSAVDKEAQEQLDRETAETQQDTQNTAASEDGIENKALEEQATAFLADVKAASRRKNGYDLGDLPPEVAERLIDSPQFASRLLDHYTAIGDGPEKTTLHNLFVDVGAMSGSPMFADLVTQKIGRNDETAEAPWFRLLADLGARTPESRNRLLEVLPNLTQSDNVSALIQAVAPEISTPETRQSVINELSPYLNHPDPKIRSSAVHTVSNWGSNQQASVLERALTDPSKDVRHAAAGAALTSNVQSDSIKSTLLTIMNSNDESMSTRIQAHYALTRYSLEDSEYNQFYQFHKLLSSPPGQQATTEAPSG